MDKLSFFLQVQGIFRVFLGNIEFVIACTVHRYTYIDTSEVRLELRLRDDVAI